MPVFPAATRYFVTTRYTAGKRAWHYAGNSLPRQWQRRSSDQDTVPPPKLALGTFRFV